MAPNCIALQVECLYPVTAYGAVDFARKRVMHRATAPYSRMDGPGTITWEEFLADAESFVCVSDKVSDSWKLLGDKSVPGEAYLAREVKQFVTEDYGLKLLINERDNENPIEDFEFQFKEDPFEAPSTFEMPLITVHHILWSISYSVPVLYFNGWKSDSLGVNRVSVEEAQGLVPDSGGLTYTELSQAIHPILNRPFLQLHPCRSHELLRNTRKSKNKLVSWLSTVAHAALKLRIRSEYYDLTL